MRTLASAGECEMLVRRLESLTPESQRRWGRMTCPQMVCHLCDSLLLGLGRKQAAPATGWFQQTVLKWAALRAPVRWAKGFPTRPEMAQDAGGTKPVEFQADRTRLVQLTREFVAAELEGRAHPVFGALTRNEWQRWALLHAEHHLRQFGC